MGWSHHEALKICQRIEPIAEKYGAHVALTGGCLYKAGERKDVDILFYRIRQEDTIRAMEMFRELEDAIGIHVYVCYGWVVKAGIKNAITEEIMDIDFFFPEQTKHDMPVDGMTFEQKQRYGCS